VTMPKENKNQNEKKTTETKLTEKKARKLSKKRAKIDRLHNILEGTSQEETVQNWSFVEIS
jgi:Asp-tRNA(Asn)/Glu-tRNA(Gln) amidotransferase B subunit